MMKAYEFENGMTIKELKEIFTCGIRLVVDHRIFSPIATVQFCYAVPKISTLRLVPISKCIASGLGLTKLQSKCMFCKTYHLTFVETKILTGDISLY